MKPLILAAAGLCLMGAAIVAAAAGQQLHVLRWWLLGTGFLVTFAALAWNDLRNHDRPDRWEQVRRHEPTDTDWRWPPR